MAGRVVGSKNRNGDPRHGTTTEYDKYKCRCEECREAKRVTRARNFKPGRTSAQRARRAKNRAERRIIVNQIKTASGCIECGFNDHPSALDFDHIVGPKLFSIAAAVNSDTPWDQILAEIEKCEIVCANHHRIRTVQRLERTGLDKDVDITNQCVSTDEQTNAHK